VKYRGIILLCALGCSTRTGMTFDRNVEEDRVIAAVLDSLIARPGTTMHVVHEFQRERPGIEPPRARLVPGLGPSAPVREATYRDLQEASRTHRTIIAIAGTRLPVRILADSVATRLREQARGQRNSLEAYWDLFRQEFPGARGQTSFSRVGFDGDQALVQVFSSCGSLCGSGWFVILERIDGRWRIVWTNVFLQV
jgi:hypothetical protein